MDLAGHRPKGLGEIPSLTWDAIVTMGCGDACPHLPARKRFDWDLPDPKDLPEEEFRKVRDEIRRRVMDLIQGMRRSAPDC